MPNATVKRPALAKELDTKKLDSMKANASTWRHNCAFNNIAHFIIENLNDAALFKKIKNDEAYKQFLQTFNEFYNLQPGLGWDGFKNLFQYFKNPIDREVMLGPVLRQHLAKHLRKDKATLIKNQKELFLTSAYAFIEDKAIDPTEQNLLNNENKKLLEPLQENYKKFKEKFRKNLLEHLAKGKDFEPHDENYQRDDEFLNLGMQYILALTETRKKFDAKIDPSDEDLNFIASQLTEKEWELFEKYCSEKFEFQFKDQFEKIWTDEGHSNYIETVESFEEKKEINDHEILPLAKALKIQMGIYSENNAKKVVLSSSLENTDAIGPALTLLFEPGHYSRVVSPNAAMKHNHEYGKNRKEDKADKLQTVFSAGNLTEERFKDYISRKISAHTASKKTGFDFHAFIGLKTSSTSASPSSKASLNTMIDTFIRDSERKNKEAKWVRTNKTSMLSFGKLVGKSKGSISEVKVIHEIVSEQPAEKSGKIEAKKQIVKHHLTVTKDSVSCNSLEAVPSLTEFYQGSSKIGLYTPEKAVQIDIQFMKGTGKDKIAECLKQFVEKGKFDIESMIVTIEGETKDLSTAGEAGSPLNAFLQEYGLAYTKPEPKPEPIMDDIENSESAGVSSVTIKNAASPLHRPLNR